MPKPTSSRKKTSTPRQSTPAPKAKKTAPPRSSSKPKRAAAASRSTPAPASNQGWKIAGALFSVLLLALAGLAGFIEGYGRRDQARQADAIVVLGAKVSPQGVPLPTLRARTMHAVSLYKRGLARKIICTGGVGTYPPSEARATATLAQRHGVAATDLVLEDKSTSTWENAVNTRRICRERNWKNVILVSDGYHLWRANYLFGRAGLNALPSPVPDSPAKTRPLLRIYWTLRETLLTVRDTIWQRS